MVSYFSVFQKLLEYLCHLLSSNVSSENTKSSGVDLADVSLLIHMTR